MRAQTLLTLRCTSITSHWKVRVDTRCVCVHVYCVDGLRGGVEHLQSHLQFGDFHKCVRYQAFNHVQCAWEGAFSVCGTGWGFGGGLLSTHLPATQTNYTHLVDATDTEPKPARSVQMQSSPLLGQPPPSPFRPGCYSRKCVRSMVWDCAQTNRGPQARTPVPQATIQVHR